ncbi:hypothetical protein ASZ90_015035 [hydrocarbon metagenome]|uniref:Uncharacterized protein n=1 Tax=hydrocarbon metagenome TaxID=938273 RepID=A0A0W8F344_9ZZZZ
MQTPHEDPVPQGALEEGYQGWQRLSRTGREETLDELLA